MEEKQGRSEWEEIDMNLQSFPPFSSYIDPVRNCGISDPKPTCAVDTSLPIRGQNMTSSCIIHDILDSKSAATLVHALVARLLQRCLVCAPRITTDKLQQVLNAAAPVVSITNKFECVTNSTHSNSHQKAFN